MLENKVDEKRFMQLAEQCMKLISITVLLGFSFEEGYAVFKTIADTIKRIGQTKQENADDIDAEIMAADLRDNLADAAELFK